jgi:hypothetical protein
LQLPKYTVHSYPSRYPPSFQVSKTSPGNNSLMQ